VGIRHHQVLEFVGSPNLPLKVPEFCYPIAEIWQPHPEFSKIGQNPAGVGIWQFVPKSGDDRPPLPNSDKPDFS
jgi:hypothetical protein